MKKLILFLSAALLIGSLASCKKQDTFDAPRAQQQSATKVALSVGIKSTATKATEDGTAAENTVSNIQVFVFKANGSAFVYEASAKADATSLDMIVTSGDKTVLVLVNEADDLTAMTDYHAILAVANSLKDNGASNFMMVGSTTYTVTETNHSIVVPVNRVAARFKIKKVTNELRNDKDKNVKVRRAYLSNVPVANNYTLTLAASNFYATTGINENLDLDDSPVAAGAEKTAVNGFIYKSIASDIVAADASYSTEIVLYGYPNDGATKKTLLVLEMEVDGKYYTYPVEIPVIAANNSYEISEFVLRSLGNSSDGDDDIDEGNENDPITNITASFSVEVLPWTVNAIANGTGADEGKYVI